MDNRETILGDGTVVLAEGSKDCPKCKKTKPMFAFGFRRMSPLTGTIRPQSHCRVCRAGVRKP